LHLNIRALEEEEDGLKGVAADFPDISLGYLSKGQARASL
jgi:hypothetical protein